MIIGIIGAMDEEILLLKESMTIEDTKKIANMDFYLGTLDGVEIALVRCGIGKVNAAICAQILIGQLGATSIINTGVAGAIHEDLEVLDVVISTDVLQHDFDVTGFGYPLGEIPRMDTSIFAADGKLQEIAIKAAGEVLKDNKVLNGRIVSGDIFVSNSELKDKLWNVFKGYSTEMEGAAIGHTCYVNNTPFVIIRAMSDKADGSAHTNFNEFVQRAAEHSKEIVRKMLRDLY